MEPSENTNEGNKEPTNPTPPDASKGEPKVTRKIAWFKKLTIANWIQVGIFLVILGSLIVNIKTCTKNNNNYNIPSVTLTPSSIVNKGKEFNPNGDSKEKETVFQIESKIENHGQVSASIEETYIWIENISDNSENLIIWDSNESYAIKSFVLFQNKAEPFNIDFYLGKDHIVKIKKKSTVYFGFYIIYNTSGVSKDLQSGPFYYWAIYRCYNFVPDKEGGKYSFVIEQSGVTKINPSLHNRNLAPKTGTQTTPAYNEKASS